MEAASWTLVTGGTGVVGSAIARRLLSDGHRVAITYGTASQVVAKLQAHAEMGNGELIAVGTDFRTLDTKTLVDSVEARGGRVGSLVHAAALVDLTEFSALTPERFADVLSVNVVAAFALVQELTRRGGLQDVVLFSSIASSFADLGSVAYTSSKGATDALTRALAVALSPSVRVNAVAPGIVRSHRTASDPLFSGALARVPGDGLVDPEDVADLVALLLEGQPRSLRGQVLTIDNAVSLRRLG